MLLHTSARTRSDLVHSSVDPPRQSQTHNNLTTITDPTVLTAETEPIPAHHNSVRLHEAIGCVTPNDEHDGRGDTIRAAPQHRMHTADQQRRAWHRSQR